jgi:hypothetical protein
MTARRTLFFTAGRPPAGVQPAMTMNRAFYTTPTHPYLAQLQSKEVAHPLDLFQHAGMGHEEHFVKAQFLNPP